MVQPLSTTGVSDIANLAAIASTAQQSGSVSAQDQASLQASLSYIASVLGVQTAQHDANLAAGDAGVVQELYTVMTPAQVISIATSLAALDPSHAVAIALATAEPAPRPGQGHRRLDQRGGPEHRHGVDPAGRGSGQRSAEYGCRAAEQR